MSQDPNSGEVQTAPPQGEANRPVIVRVKRKASQSPLAAFWLEIRERRTLQLSDVEISEQKTDAHSISNSSAGDEETESRKVFVKYVSTMPTLDLPTLDQLSLLNSGGGSGAEPINQIIESDNIMSNTARFKQIWRENKEKSDSDLTGNLTELFTLYDFVRVDGVESRESDNLHSEIEESRMRNAAAADNESAMTDEYLYDYYNVSSGVDSIHDSVMENEERELSKEEADPPFRRLVSTFRRLISTFCRLVSTTRFGERLVSTFHRLVSTFRRLVPTTRIEERSLSEALLALLATPPTPTLPPPILPTGVALGIAGSCGGAMLIQVGPTDQYMAVYVISLFMGLMCSISVVLWQKDRPEERHPIGSAAFSYCAICYFVSAAVVFVLSHNGIGVEWIWYIFWAVPMVAAASTVWHWFRHLRPPTGLPIDMPPPAPPRDPNIQLGYMWGFAEACGGAMLKEEAVGPDYITTYTNLLFVGFVFFVSAAMTVTRGSPSFPLPDFLLLIGLHMGFFALVNVVFSRVQLPFGSWSSPGSYCMAVSFAVFACIVYHRYLQGSRGGTHEKQR